MSAADYENVTLFCNFLLDLPPGWTAGEQTKLAGSTQRCRLHILLKQNQNICLTFTSKISNQGEALI